jgi:hypothetical protein
MVEYKCCTNYTPAAGINSSSWLSSHFQARLYGMQYPSQYRSCFLPPSQLGWAGPLAFGVSVAGIMAINCSHQTRGVNLKLRGQHDFCSAKMHAVDPKIVPGLKPFLERMLENFC